MDMKIAFVDPATWVFDVDRFASARIGGHACGDVYLQRPALRAGTKVHLAREIDGGFELRSRYWIGDRAELRLPGRSPALTRAALSLGLTRRTAGARVAYEQLLHDQIEFTYLAGFLPATYREFAAADAPR